LQQRGLIFLFNPLLPFFNERVDFCLDRVFVFFNEQKRSRSLFGLGPLELLILLVILVLVFGTGLVKNIMNVVRGMVGNFKETVHPREINVTPKKPEDKSEEKR